MAASGSLPKLLEGVGPPTSGINARQGYDIGSTFFVWLTETYGIEAHRELMQAIRGGMGRNAALEHVTGLSVAEIESAWRVWLGASGNRRWSHADDARLPDRHALHVWQPTPHSTVDVSRPGSAGRVFWVASVQRCARIQQLAVSKNKKQTLCVKSGVVRQHRERRFCFALTANYEKPTLPTGPSQHADERLAGRLILIVPTCVRRIASPGRLMAQDGTSDHLHARRSSSGSDRLSSASMSAGYSQRATLTVAQAGETLFEAEAGYEQRRLDAYTELIAT